MGSTAKGSNEAFSARHPMELQSKVFWSKAQAFSAVSGERWAVSGEVYSNFRFFFYPPPTAHRSPPTATTTSPGRGL